MPQFGSSEKQMPRCDMVCEIFVEEVARDIRESFQALRPVEEKREGKRMGQKESQTAAKRQESFDQANAGLSGGEGAPESKLYTGRVL